MTNHDQNMVTPNQGIQLLVADYGEAPQKSGLLGNLATMTFPGATGEVIDVTSVSSKTGIKRFKTLLMEYGESTMTFWLDNENYSRIILNRLLKGTPINGDWDISLAFVFPRSKGSSRVPNLVFTGVVTGFNPLSDVGTNSVRQFSFTFKPDNIPEFFVDYGVVSSITASPKTFTQEGGVSTVTITGVELEDGILVSLNNPTTDDPIPNTDAVSRGSATEQKVTIKVPPNKGATQLTFDVVAYNNGTDPYDESDTITVSAAD